MLVCPDLLEAASYVAIQHNTTQQPFIGLHYWCFWATYHDLMPVGKNGWALKSSAVPQCCELCCFPERLNEATHPVNARQSPPCLAEDHKSGVPSWLTVKAMSSIVTPLILRSHPGYEINSKQYARLRCSCRFLAGVHDDQYVPTSKVYFERAALCALLSGNLGPSMHAKENFQAHL